jgi:alpha-tubulin suppressor-like RCC1 family protein
VRCWGRNNRGQAKAPSGQFVAISAGGAHTCAVSVSGYTLCWGDAAFGQLKAPLPPTFSELVPGGDVSGGMFETILCGIRTDGTRFCTNAPPGYPSLPDPQLHGFALAGTGNEGPACALRADQSVQCWGLVGSWAATLLTPPTGAFDAITVGGVHACGLRSSGKIVCWGNNDRQQLDVPAELKEP